MARKQKIRLGILFGGRSGEHEVSLTSAASVIGALDPSEFEITAIGITIEVEEMPVEQWYGTIGSPDWGLAYMWYFNATGDPAELISWFLAEGNPETARAMTAAGCDVHTYPATQIGVNGSGGPTCLTRPILRD